MDAAVSWTAAGSSDPPKHVTYRLRQLNWSLVVNMQDNAGGRVLLARPVTCGQTLVTDDVGGQFVTFKG